VDLFLNFERGEYIVRIRDNGCGLPDPVPDLGSGILNLRSRAAALGGTLSIASAPRAGADLTVRFPTGRTAGWLGRMIMLFRDGPRMGSNRR
jgi:signal transduction histidine kinase